MKRAFTLLVTSACWFAAMAVLGCTSPVGSGGGAATPCPTTGICPGNLQCHNGYCVYVADTGGSDGASTDTAAADNGTVPDVPATQPDSAATEKDTAPQIEDLGPIEDVKVVDVAKSDTIKDDAKDGGGKDAPKADVEALATTIQDIQSAASSQTCADSGAIVTSGKVKLTSVVLTVAPTKIKGASGYNTIFYVSPLDAPNSPAYAGVQVMVIGETMTFNAGDALDLTGDVNEFYCMTQVVANPADVQLIGQTPVPPPYVIPVQQLAPGTAEPYEGDLVAVQNVYVSNANVFGSDGKPHAQFAIGPGSGASVVTVALPFGSAMTTKDASGNLTPNVQTGQMFSSITGNVSYSFGVWLLRPRNDADMVP